MHGLFPIMSTTSCWCSVPLRSCAFTSKRGSAIRLAGAVLLALAAGGCCRGEAAQDAAAPPMPSYRIETDGFNASEADIRAVLDSAGGQLWRFFPGYKLEPFVVTRGHHGPITLYRRNDRGEIVVCLDTGQQFWCQYAYQFAHEFCHVLCGLQHEPGYEGNKWLEETVCETASLFAIRGMSRQWKDHPPYPNWRDYRDSLRDYADDVVRQRQGFLEICAQGMPAFYRAHRPAIEKDPCCRELNGAMSIVFLQLLEEQPERWESVRWLNSSRPPQGEPLEGYLRRWYGAVPERHKPTVQRVGELYGLRIGPAETARPKTAGAVPSGKPADRQPPRDRPRP